MPKKQLNLYMEDEIVDGLKMRGMHMSKYVENALKFYIDSNEIVEHTEMMKMLDLMYIQCNGCNAVFNVRAFVKMYDKMNKFCCPNIECQKTEGFILNESEPVI